MSENLFIQLGWHTVPLEGELKRLPDGKKTLPKFPKNWNIIYKEKFNTEDTGLLLLLTGQQSGVVAIDCDDELITKLVEKLVGDYKFYFVSKGKIGEDGKEIKCKTFIFLWEGDLPPSFKLHNKINIDFFNETGGIYLPSSKNYTKYPFPYTLENVPELTKMPEELKTVLWSFYRQTKIKEEPKEKVIKTSKISGYRLYYLVKNFVDNDGEYSPKLFKIITPKDFRSLPQYIKFGHLHPDDVPDGRGSEYLSKVSAILGADPSIDTKLYSDAMVLINNLWSKPMPLQRLKQTIIDPMIQQKAVIDGEPIWQYDPEWRQEGFIETASTGDLIEAFFDDRENFYVFINYNREEIKIFDEKSKIIKYLRSLVGRKITEAEFDKRLNIVRTEENPAKRFGFNEERTMFNLFRPTRALEILNNPEEFSGGFNIPYNILKFFESLVPDESARTYLFRFLRTKLTTFKYSPVIIYLLGVQGSGKDTFVNLLGKLVGEEKIAKPDAKVFLEQYNGWIKGKLFAQLDEYGNKVFSLSAKEEVLGKLKSYTGSPQVQIREMRRDAYNYTHRLTFILTANKNPLPLELGDRRVFLIETPNVLTEQDFVKEMGIGNFIQKLNEEIEDFAYFLGVNYSNLLEEEYVNPPLTHTKQEIIEEFMKASDRIAILLKHKEIDKLIELFEEHSIINYKEGWDKGKIFFKPLVELVEILSNNSEGSRQLAKALELQRIVKLRTNHTLFGSTYYIPMPELKNYTGFTEINLEV